MKAFVFALLVAVGSPSPAALVYRGPAAVKAVTITFDAGADRGYAPRILATLERFHVRATFGMTGTWARANPDLVRRMARDGDTFVNHTYDHRSFTGYSTRTGPLTARQRAWEITQTERIIHSLTGKTTRPYFRPPFGDLDSAVSRQVSRLGYTRIVMWTLDSLGWEGLSAGAIVSRVLDNVSPGAIYLMHVGIQSQDALALPAVLRGLRKDGYSVVPLPALLAGRRR